MRLITFFFALWVFASSVAAQQWDKDQQAIIEVNRFVPLALKEVGFDGYAALFHPDYTNWYMIGDLERLTQREQYLANVKVWFEKGNYANFSKVVPISVAILPISGICRKSILCTLMAHVPCLLGILPV